MSRPGSGLATRLGWVSFFNDAAGEVLARALPLALAATGGSPAFIGTVEGLAEAAALGLKAASGWLSDRLPSRKPLVSAGYGLSVAARAAYAFALPPLALGAARVADRVGKGLRGAPRDAMVADAARAGERGRDFGITRFLDTLGAVTGLLAALALGLGRGSLTPAAFRRLAVWALVPGLALLALLAFWVPRVPRDPAVRKGLRWGVPREVRGYLALVALFGLANSSDAFLVLRARELGWSFGGILGLMAAFNLLAALLAVPAGRASDRFGRVRFLAAGWAVYGLCYGAVALLPGRAAFAGALLAYGAFYGLTEGIEKALLGDLLAPEHRGLGYGALQVVLGVSALAASVAMGWLLQRLGPAAAFGTEAALALAASALLAAWGLARRGGRSA